VGCARAAVRRRIHLGPAVRAPDQAAFWVSRQQANEQPSRNDRVKDVHRIFTRLSPTAYLICDHSVLYFARSMERQTRRDQAKDKKTEVGNVKNVLPQL
jgi:hypothetical protein